MHHMDSLSIPNLANGNSMSHKVGNLYCISDTCIAICLSLGRQLESTVQVDDRHDTATFDDFRLIVDCIEEFLGLGVADTCTLAESNRALQVLRAARVEFDDYGGIYLLLPQSSRSLYLKPEEVTTLLRKSESR